MFRERLFTVIVLCISGILWTAPYAGDIMELQQPDGSMVQVRFWGDEYYCRGESLDGYTVVRDPATGWIVYAELNEEESEFIPTEAVYDHGQSTDPNNPVFAAHRMGIRNAGGTNKEHANGFRKQLKQRQACGYRDEEYLNLRILHLHQTTYALSG